MQSVPYGVLGCVVPGGQRLEARGSCLNRLDPDIALAGHVPHECLCRTPR
jgi:hypothetical protein